MSDKKICFLSGLEIPKGQYSREHIAPRSKIPVYIANLPYNIAPAIKIFNCIKADRFLCEWEAQKFELTYNALKSWNLKKANKDVIIRALDRFATEKDTLNPCQHCILSSTAKEYCYAQRDLEKYRIRWLYDIKSREGQIIR